ncbi:MAG TPA: DUF2905 domain-containing protein [Myxococcales bacterium]|jgi:hypothetical protein|nr:DUF2905 domain-containing protein [Myxococcales bacterium]
MDSMGKLLLICGLAIAALGGVVLLISRTGLHRLPGDIVVRRGNFTFYAPIGLMILLSIILTVVLNLIARR